MLPRLTAVLLFCLCLQAAEARRVIVIGYDGMSPDGLRKAKAPNIDAIRHRGSWTYHARGVFPTVSSPNWASMIMGAGPERHGITSNEWTPAQHEIPPVCAGKSGLFPTVFGELREQRPDAVIGIFHHWDDFARLVEPGAPDRIEHGATAQDTIRLAIAYLREKKPDLLFIHLDLVDDAGHEYGHGSPEYLRAIEEADRLTGLVVAAVKELGVADRTVFLLTADHGGIGKKHGGMTMAELEIPWIVAGPGIVADREITTPVSTCDTAATIAALLGVKPSPCWIGHPIAGDKPQP